MIVCFTNNTPEGRNALAYSIACAEHYNTNLAIICISHEDIQVPFFLRERMPVLDNYIKRCRKSNLIKSFREEQIVEAIEYFESLRHVKAIVFSHCLKEKFGHLRITQKVINHAAPLLSVKETTIFTPIEDIVMGSHTIETNNRQDILDQLKEQLAPETSQAKKPTFLNRKKQMSKKKISPTQITEEIATTQIVSQYNIQNLNALRIKRKGTQAFKLIKSNNVLRENPPRFN